MTTTQTRLAEMIEETREQLSDARGAARAAETNVERLEEKLQDLDELQRLAANEAAPRPTTKTKN